MSKQNCTSRIRDMQQQQQQECCICLEPLSQQLTTLHCGHRLHTDCLMQLIDKQTTTIVYCPLCRAEIFTFVNRQPPSNTTSMPSSIFNIQQRTTSHQPPPQQQVIFINDDIIFVDREQLQITHRKQIIALLGTLSAAGLFFSLMLYDAFFKA